MAVLRPHLALNVSDIDRSVDFYAALFGTSASKLRPGYAKFELVDPALNLTLNERARTDDLGAFNHAGIQVDSTDEVLAAQLRLKAAGLATFDEFDSSCCYAKQDKIWVHDPDGTPWEIFTVHGDSEPGDETVPIAGEQQAASPCCDR